MPLRQELFDFCHKLISEKPWVRIASVVFGCKPLAKQEYASSRLRAGSDAYPGLFKSCPPLRVVSTESAVRAQSRDGLTPGGKNRRPFSRRPFRSTIRRASPAAGNNAASRDAG